MNESRPMRYERGAIAHCVHTKGVDLIHHCCMLVCMHVHVCTRVIMRLRVCAYMYTVCVWSFMWVDPWRK